MVFIPHDDAMSSRDEHTHSLCPGYLKDLISFLSNHGFDCGNAMLIVMAPQ